MREEELFTTGSGDIFKDFGFSDDESAVLNIKAALFRTLQDALKKLSKGQTQAELAKMLGIPQPQVSDIIKGKISGFSMERIANYLVRLGYEVIVAARPAKAAPPRRQKANAKKRVSASTIRQTRTSVAK
ncbi:MAG TPA: helix-turn-helix transcriptional regulator [Candidatus Obscuribacterales bacterium]